MRLKSSIIDVQREVKVNGAGLDGRLEELEAEFRGLEDRIDSIEQNQTLTLKELRGIRQHLNKSIIDMHGRINELECKLKEVRPVQSGAEEGGRGR